MSQNELIHDSLKEQKKYDATMLRIFFFTLLIIGYVMPASAGNTEWYKGKSDGWFFYNEKPPEPEPKEEKKPKPEPEPEPQAQAKKESKSEPAPVKEHSNVYD